MNQIVAFAKNTLVWTTVWATVLSAFSTFKSVQAGEGVGGSDLLIVWGIWWAISLPVVLFTKTLGAVRRGARHVGRKIVDGVAQGSAASPQRPSPQPPYRSRR